MTEKREIILSPIEVAIDEMTTKVIDIREVVDLVMPDMKKLQLKLQGSVSAQVRKFIMMILQPRFMMESLRLIYLLFYINGKQLRSCGDGGHLT